MLVWIVRIGTILVSFLPIIWRFIQRLAKMKLTWIFVAFYPILSFIMEIFTGRQSFISSIVQNFITSMLNAVLSHVFDIDLQTAINAIPAQYMQFACYIGVTGAAQIVFDGIMSAMVILFQLQLTLLVFWIKSQLAWRAMRLTKM